MPDGGGPASIYVLHDGDVSQVIPGQEQVGYVVGYTLPLTVEDGAMTIDVSVVE